MNFVIIENNKQVKKIDVKLWFFFIRNAIEMKGIGIGMFGVKKLSFLANKVTK